MRELKGLCRIRVTDVSLILQLAFRQGNDEIAKTNDATQTVQTTSAARR